MKQRICHAVAVAMFLTLCLVMGCAQNSDGSYSITVNSIMDAIQGKSRQDESMTLNQLAAVLLPSQGESMSHLTERLKGLHGKTVTVLLPEETVLYESYWQKNSADTSPKQARPASECTIQCYVDSHSASLSAVGLNFSEMFSPQDLAKGITGGSGLSLAPLGKYAGPKSVYAAFRLEGSGKQPTFMQYKLMGTLNDGKVDEYFMDLEFHYNVPATKQGARQMNKGHTELK